MNCFKNYNFEVIIDSYAVVRNNTELFYTFHPFSPNGNILQNNSTTRKFTSIQSSTFIQILPVQHTFICVYVCICVVLYSFITCIDSSDHHETIQSQGSLVLPFIVTGTSLPPALPFIWQFLIRLYNLVMSTMLHTWNRTLYNHTSMQPFEIGCFSFSIILSQSLQVVVFISSLYILSII